MKRLKAILLVVVAGSGGVQAGDPVVAPKPPGAVCDDCRFTSPPSAKQPRGGPQLPPGQDMPRPLPVPQDAVPLVPRSGETAIQSLVEEHLADLTPEEQKIWIDELHGLPVEVARELLLARDRANASDPLGPLHLFDAFEPPLPSEPPLQSEPPVPSPAASDAASSFANSIGVLREAELIILGNIANAETIGFKRIAPFTTGGGTNRDVAGLAPRHIQTQGPLRETGRRLDLALEGPGLFQVERAETRGLTRAGLFQLNADGFLAMTIDQQQWLLHPNIQIPAEASEVRIDVDGTVHCRMTAGGPTVSVGRIELVLVTDFSQLESLATGLWTIPAGIVPMRSGAAGDAGFATVRSGFVEGSNIDLDEEFDALEQVRRQIAALRGQQSGQLAENPDAPPPPHASVSVRQHRPRSPVTAPDINEPPEHSPARARKAFPWSRAAANQATRP